jgi:hypothetical protein
MRRKLQLFMRVLELQKRHWKSDGLDVDLCRFVDSRVSNLFCIKYDHRIWLVRKGWNAYTIQINIISYLRSD